MFVSVQMVVAAFIPAFELKVAAGDGESLLGQPVALAPGGGDERRIGQVSATAEAQGVVAGMLLGEAMSRCPGLQLLPPDPVGGAIAWERVLTRLEGIGAEVATPVQGTALFEADGLLRLHLGLGGLLDRTRSAAGRSVRVGVAASPFAALAAASSARTRKPVVVAGGVEGARRFLAPLGVRALSTSDRAATLPPLLERLGLVTLGAFADLPVAKVADRFGRAGVEAHELACGRGPRLQPRRRPLVLSEAIEIPESSDGRQLAYALDLLIRRLLAREERAGRGLRTAEVQAALDGGGTWSREVCFREALVGHERISLALTPVLASLPGPARALRLVAGELGPPAADQQSLIREPHAMRLARLREAVRQTRTVGGPDSAMRAVAVDPDSRLPELRMALTPFEA